MVNDDRLDELVAGESMQHPSVDVLGVRIDAIELDEFLTDVANALSDHNRLTVTFANPNYLMAAADDSRLRDRINSFDLVLTDGWGVMLAARLLGRRIPVRLANDDLVRPLFRLLARRGSRVFFLGSAPGIAAQAAGRMAEAFPGLQVAGVMHGFLDAEAGYPGAYSVAASEAMVDAVNEPAPDLLIVGLPTPDQQRFVTDNLHRLRASVVLTGGGWIDHLAERVQYYPTWVTRLRLCWAYRWMREPRRLARRYTVELARFGRRVLMQRTDQRRRRRAAR